MDQILFNQRFNGFLRSPYFASLDDQGQQESIVRYRDNALADFPDLNPDDVNRIVELENKKYLREAGKGRAIPTGWQEKVQLPNWDKDWNTLSQDEKVNRVEEFKGKASEYADLFPTQKEDAEFYFEQLGRTLEREVQGEDKGWIGDKGSRIMQGFTAGLANYTGMTGVAEWMEDFWHENPKYDGDLMADLAQGIGDVGASMTIFLGAAAFTAKTMGAGAAMTGGTLASLGSNSFMRYNEGYKNAIDAGLNSGKAHEAGINSVPAAFIDVLGDRILAARLRPTRDMGAFVSGTTKQKRELITDLIKDNTTKAKLLSLAGSSVSEGLTESVGDYYAGYAAYATDPNNEAPPELDESKRSFLIGMILGGGIAAPGTFAPMIGNKSGQTRTEDGQAGTIDTTLKYSNRTIRDLSELNINLDSIEETGQQPVFDLLAQGKYRDAYKMTQEIMAGKMQSDTTTNPATETITPDVAPEQQAKQPEAQPEQQDARIIAFKELSSIAELDRKTTTPINNHSRKMAVERLNNVAPARLNVEKSILGWADSTTSIRSQKDRAPRANAVMSMVDHLAGKWQQQNKDKDVNVFYGKLNINSEESIEGLRGVIQSIEGAPQAAVSRQNGQMAATLTPASDLNTVVKSITSMLRKSGMMESIMGEQDYAKVVETLEVKDGWTVEKDNQLGDMFTGWVADSSTGAELGNVFARLKGYVRDVYESVKKLAYPSSWTRMKKLDEEFSRMFQLDVTSGEFEMGIKPRPRAKGQTVAPNATKPPAELESTKAKVAAEQARNKAAELKAAIANDPSIQTNENTDVMPEGNSITDYLNTLIDKHRGNARKDVRLRNIYTRLRDAIAQNNPDLGFVYDPTFEHKGVYNGFTNTITVSDLTDTETLIHEISHAITDAKLNAGTRRYDGSYVQKVQALSKENTPEGRIARAYLKAAKQLGKGKEIGKKYDDGDVDYGDYAFYNLNEFVAFAMSNTQFQETLSGIKYENSTLLDRIVEYIKEAAGFISDMSGIDINSILLSPNALYDTLANVNELIEARGGQDTDSTNLLPRKEGKYEVYDRQTKEVVWRGDNRRTARQVQDRRDNDYGGYRYGVREMKREAGENNINFLPSEIKYHSGPAKISKIDLESQKGIGFHIGNKSQADWVAKDKSKSVITPIRIKPDAMIESIDSDAAWEQPAMLVGELYHYGIINQTDAGELINDWESNKEGSLLKEGEWEALIENERYGIYSNESVDKLDDLFDAMSENFSSRGNPKMLSDIRKMLTDVYGIDVIQYQNEVEGIGDGDGTSYVVLNPDAVEIVEENNINFLPRLAPQQYARHSELEQKNSLGNITPDEIAEAQSLVDEAAEKAGWPTERFYHGTMQGGFSEFDTNKSGYHFGQGAYFTPSKRRAENYQGVRQGYEDGQEWRDPDPVGSQLYEVYLKINNPYIVSSDAEISDIGFKMANENRAEYDKLAGQTGFVGPGTTNIGNQFIRNQGYDAILKQWKPNETLEAVVFNPNQIKSAQPFTGVPLEERFNSEENNINFLPRDIERLIRQDEQGQDININSEQVNYLPHQKKSQKFRSLYDKLDKIQKGKLDSKVDAATQSIISAAKRINKTDLEYLDQDSLEAVDKIVNNIYKARTRGLKDPAVRLDAAKVIGQIEIAVSAIEGAVVAKMLADYDGILDIDSLEFDSLDSLRQAINVAMGEEQFKAGLSQKNAEKLEAIYQGYRDKIEEIKTYISDRYADANNYLESMEAVSGEFLTNDMREAIVENYNQIMEEDHSETVSKDLYLTFFAANAMMDGQILHLRDIAVKRIANKLDDQVDFAGLANKTRDIEVKVKGLNVVDKINRKVELMQVQVQRLSVYEDFRNFINENVIGPINRAVFGDYNNLVGKLMDQWKDAVKTYHKKTGRKDLTNIDKEILSVALRAVQVQHGELADAALVKNLEAEMKSLENRINNASDQGHKNLLDQEIKPLIQNFYKGVETMDQLIVELEQRLSNGEGSTIGEGRLELFKTAQNIFSVFGNGSKVISEGVYGRAFKGFHFYVPNLTETSRQNKNQYNDLEDSAFTYTEGYGLPASNAMPAFLENRSQKLGKDTWYAYNVEYVIQRGVEMMAAEHTTVIARKVLSERLKEGNRLYNLIAFDSDGKAHPERVQLLKDHAVEIVKRAASRGEPAWLGVGTLQSLLGATARVNLSSPHHLISQPAAGLIDYVMRSGNPLHNIKNYFDAAFYFATHPTKVADFFKENARFIFDRSFLDTIAVDQRRQIKATEKAFLSSPFIKGLGRLYRGIGDALTFGIREGDKFGNRVIMLAEYKRRMEEKGHKYEDIDALIKSPVNLDVMVQSALEMEKNINATDKIARGELFADRKNMYVIAKNLFFAYAPHSASLASQFNMAARDLVELSKNGGPVGEILAKTRVMGAILSQAVLFAGSRAAIGYYTSHLIINLVKDMFDDEEGKLAELTEAVRVARKKGDPVEVELAEETKRNAMVVRNVVNQIKNNATYDGFFKSAIRDASGSTFLAFNNPTFLRYFSQPIDEAMKRGHADFRKETINGYKEQIREAKEKQDWMRAAELEEKLINFRGEQYIPINFDTYNQEMGGALGIFASNLNRQWGRARHSIDPVKEFNLNDFVLMATVAGIGQSEVRKFLNAVDQIENEQFENNIKFQEELIPKALEEREEKRQREIKKILGIR